MAYESQYKPVYYQRTSTGRPREAKDSELNQISNSLKNFNKSFDVNPCGIRTYDGRGRPRRP